jgi:hypothetical protein
LTASTDIASLTKGVITDIPKVKTVPEKAPSEEESPKPEIEETTEEVEEETA